MRSGAPRGYVPIIGSAMLQPLLDLVQTVEQQSERVGVPNEVQTSCWEYGYCTSIIILAVVVLESAVNRARYIRNEGVERKTVVYFKKIVQDPDLSSLVEELFVVRDIIAHNHVWRAEVVDDGRGLRHTKPPILITGYGDKKYLDRVDLNTRTTKKLKLNVFPTKIWREDVLKVLDTVEVALSALDKIDPSYFGVNQAVLTFHGEYVSFSEAVARMRKTRLGM